MFSQNSYGMSKLIVNIMIMPRTAMYQIKALFFVILLNLAFSTPSLACDTSIILAAANTISLDQAVNRVKKNSKGKVLGAKTVIIDGHPTHVIKVLTKSGRVKRVRVPTRPSKH